MAIHIDAIRFSLHSEIYEEAATREPVFIYADGVLRNVLISLDVVDALKARRAAGSPADGSDKDGAEMPVGR